MCSGDLANVTCFSKVAASLWCNVNANARFSLLNDGRRASISVYMKSAMNEGLRTEDACTQDVTLQSLLFRQQAA